MPPKPPVVEKKPVNQMEIPMSKQEKQTLKDSIPRLNMTQQTGILTIVQESLPKTAQGEVYEFELDMLPVRKCRELEKYVNDCIKENIKKTKRKEADKIRRDKQRSTKLQATQPVQFQMQKPSETQPQP